jgi:hypothetical protein
MTKNTEKKTKRAPVSWENKAEIVLRLLNAGGNWDLKDDSYSDITRRPKKSQKSQK